MLPALRKINFKEYDLYIRLKGSEIKVPDKINTVLQLKEFAYKQSGPKTYHIYFSKKGTTVDEGRKTIVVTEKSNPLKFKISDETIEKKDPEIINKKETKEMPDIKEYYELREKINEQNHKIQSLEKELAAAKTELLTEIVNLKSEFIEEMQSLQDQLDEEPEINPVEDPIASYKPLLDLMPLLVSASNKNSGTDYDPEAVKDYLVKNPDKLKDMYEQITKIKKIEPVNNTRIPGSMPG